jgi:hypothetical protein
MFASFWEIALDFSRFLLLFVPSCWPLTHCTTPPHLWPRHHEFPYHFPAAIPHHFSAATTFLLPLHRNHHHPTTLTTTFPPPQTTAAATTKGQVSEPPILRPRGKEEQSRRQEWMKILEQSRTNTRQTTQPAATTFLEDDGDFADTDVPRRHTYPRDLGGIFPQQENNTLETDTTAARLHLRGGSKHHSHSRNSSANNPVITETVNRQKEASAQQHRLVEARKLRKRADDGAPPEATHLHIYKDDKDGYDDEIGLDRQPDRFIEQWEASDDDDDDEYEYVDDDDDADDVDASDQQQNLGVVEGSSPGSNVDVSMKLDLERSNELIVDEFLASLGDEGGDDLECGGTVVKSDVGVDVGVDAGVDVSVDIGVDAGRNMEDGIGDNSLCKPEPAEETLVQMTDEEANVEKHIKMMDVIGEFEATQNARGGDGCVDMVDGGAHVGSGTNAVEEGASSESAGTKDDVYRCEDEAGLVFLEALGGALPKWDTMEAAGFGVVLLRQLADNWKEMAAQSDSDYTNWDASDWVEMGKEVGFDGTQVKGTDVPLLFFNMGENDVDSLQAKASLWGLDNLSAANFAHGLFRLVFTVTLDSIMSSEGHSSPPHETIDIPSALQYNLCRCPFSPITNIIISLLLS